MTEMTRYTLPHRLLHWTMALAIIVSIPIGVVMGDVKPGPFQNALYDFHKSLGVLVLVLALIRVALKHRFGVPDPSPELADWQLRSATSVHHALYALMIVVPLLGFVANSFYGATMFKLKKNHLIDLFFNCKVD